MALWIVTWDGPEAGRRAQASWHSRENAVAHYMRKASAGLDPQLDEQADEDEPAEDVQ